jgi:hypothetical protein
MQTENKQFEKVYTQDLRSLNITIGKAEYDEDIKMFLPYPTYGTHWAEDFFDRIREEWYAEIGRYATRTENKELRDHLNTWGGHGGFRNGFHNGGISKPNLKLLKEHNIYGSYLLLNSKIDVVLKNEEFTFDNETVVEMLKSWNQIKNDKLPQNSLKRFVSILQMAVAFGGQITFQLVEVQDV